MKRTCVATRIGDGKALDAGNIQNIGQSSNHASADSGRNPHKQMIEYARTTWGWREFWPMALSQATFLE